MSRPDVRPRLLILADDLSGAADCAVACRRAGMAARVRLDIAGADFDGALAIDLDSRRLGQAEAAARTRAVMPMAAGRTLYRKVDSTLRGHVGAEIAATLHAAGAGAFAIVCPAYPAMGRVVLDGRVWVRGLPLEQTEIWRLAGGGPSDLARMLSAQGLKVAKVILPELRWDAEDAIRNARERGAQAILCDAETELDLEAIVEAGLALTGAIWAGSGGLAIPLAAALARGEPAPAPSVARRAGPHLMVAGSASSVSREQWAALADDPGVIRLLVPPRVLLQGPEGPGWRPVTRALVAAVGKAGRDVVAVSIESSAPGDLADGPALARALGRLIGRQLARFGSLTATGGETARAILAEAGASALDIVAELEPGVVLSMLEGRGLPVVTKAGAYGDRLTLARVAAALRALPLA